MCEKCSEFPRNTLPFPFHSKNKNRCRSDWAMLQPFQETASTHTEQGNTYTKLYIPEQGNTSRAGQYINYIMKEMRCNLQHNTSRGKFALMEHHEYTNNTIFSQVLRTLGILIIQVNLKKMWKMTHKMQCILETYTCTGIHVTKNMGNWVKVDSKLVED